LRNTAHAQFLTIDSSNILIAIVYRSCSVSHRQFHQVPTPRYFGYPTDFS